MVRYLVAPVSGTDADDGVIGCALGVAKIFGAHAEFLHVRVDVTRVAVEAGAAGGLISPGGIDAMQAGEATAEARALAAVTGLAEAAGAPLQPTAASADGCSADFAVETGSEGEWLAEYGRFADLIVVGRRKDGTGAGIDVLETALLNSNRPILIAAPAGPGVLTKTVVIAWTDAPEALRAVHAAMPFIARAERVVVLCVDAGPDDAAAAERLRRALRWHNAKVSVRAETSDGGDAFETLRRCAKSLDATLLVMGGYGHSPLRELLFGGTTHSVLADADLPVLMAH